MKRKWVFVSIAPVVAALGIMSGCSHTPDNQPWASFASEVALKIDIAEDRVSDAFEQAFKEGTDIPGDSRSSRRIPELTEEDVEQIVEWYQNRPEGVTITGLHTIQYFDVEVQLLSAGSRSMLDSLAVRVASILGLDQQTIVTAFHLVHREDQDEMHKGGLDSLVEEGVLTKEQAGRYYQWYLTRPDTVAPGRMSAVK